MGAEVIGDDVDGDDVVASAVGKDKGANDDDDHNDDSPSSKSSSESDNDEVLDDWMFPSFHVLMLWGIFVEPELRLDIAVLDDQDRKKDMDNRKQSRGRK